MAFDIWLHAADVHSPLFARVFVSEGQFKRNRIPLLPNIRQESVFV
jgi:hypothetical protein